MRSSPNVVGDALKTPDAPRQIGDVAQHVQTQLTSSIDVKAAHQWVQPSGGEMHLPNLGLGSEAAGMHAAVVPGGEQHALAAAQQVGNQAISPIIQMIMKMPGHIGLISSFFEALQSFFAPMQDLIGGLDASMFTAHLDAAAGALSRSGEHLGLDLSLIPDDAPMFNMDDGGGGFADLLPKDASTAFNGGELKFHPSEMSDSSGSALNTSGYSDAAGGGQFEQSAQGLEAASTHVRDGIVTPQYLAMDNGQAIFRPTMGGFNNMQSSTIQVPPNVTPQQPTIVHPLTHQIAPHHPVGGMARDIVQPHLPEHAAPIEQHAAAPVAQHTAPIEQHAAPAVEQAADRGTLLGHPQPRIEHTVDQVTSDQQVAGDAQGPTEQVAETPGAPEQGAEATTSYTVKPGDNLWDIAQHHLGDGLKWQEIYQLNHELLGGDPTLIHPGTEIQLPGGGQELASNYTVQPGDNLWDISKANLGGGQHWGELFHQNSDVIGSNPSLIHPGQHLDMAGGASHTGQLASVDPSHAAGHTAPSHVAHHATPQHQQVAHNTPAHHVAHHGSADHAKVAANTPHASHPAEAATQQVAAGSQQVPEAIAATPSGAEAGLHASAPMGSLETTAQSLPNH